VHIVCRNKIGVGKIICKGLAALPRTFGIGYSRFDIGDSRGMFIIEHRISNIEVRVITEKGETPTISPFSGSSAPPPPGGALG